MKLLFAPTIALALLASTAQAAPLAQQASTKCNAKTSTPASATVAVSSSASAAASYADEASATNEALDYSMASSTNSYSASTAASTTQDYDASAAASTSDNNGTASVGGDAEYDESSSALSSGESSYYAESTSAPSSRESSYYAETTEASTSATTDYSASTGAATTDYSGSAGAAATTTSSSGDDVTATSACTLSGTYSEGTDVSSCDTIVISDLTVPAGVTLDLTDIADGATISFQGTTTFGEDEWDGPLVLLTGNELTVTGSGTLDGQGDYYWEKGTSITRPVFFRMKKVMSSTISNFNIKNSPYRTFSILSCEQTTISGLTLDSSAGDDLAKNTDGFDLSRNIGLTIEDCTVYNQDDCLAMQSSNDTTFTGNTCSGGHGISIGSLGGDSVSESDIVNGLTVSNNKIVDSVNGIRIKTIIDKYGTVTAAKYTDNTLDNVENAIVVHSDYSKSEGGYTGDASSLVEITDITISGLSGTADDIYDILVNPDVVSGWTFSDITVEGDSGSCSGEPSDVDC